MARSSHNSLVLFHCSFADDGPTIAPHQPYNMGTYMALPYLYAVCVIDESRQPERLAAGLMLRTSVEYGDPGFHACMEAAMLTVPRHTRRSLYSDVCLLPAAVDCDMNTVITSQQALLVFQHLWSEHMTHELIGRLIRPDYALRHQPRA